MRIAVLFFFGIATTLLAVAGSVRGLSELAMASCLIAGLPLLAVTLHRTSLVHASLALYAALTAVFGLFGMPAPICAGALAAALVGWDAWLQAPHVARASAELRARFAVAYGLRATGVAGIGVLLVGLAGTVRLSLTFGWAFGLSFVVLILAAFFLRSLGRSVKPNLDARAERK